MQGLRVGAMGTAPHNHQRGPHLVPSASRTAVGLLVLSACLPDTWGYDAGLSSESRELLDAAALIGARVELRLLEAVMPGRPSVRRRVRPTGGEP